MPHKVTVQSGQQNVALPNGLSYKAADVVVLTDEQFSKLSDDIFVATLTDNGPYGTVVGNGAISVQAAHVANAAAATSVAVATTTATNTTPWGYSTQAQANAVVTSINELVVDVAAIIAKINAELAALEVAGGPQASS